MKTTFLQLIALLLLAQVFTAAAPLHQSSAQGRLYELRVYYAEAGKLDALLNRFRKHTLGLFKKHGMRNEGYWLPIDNAENKLVYVLSYPDEAAREKAWQQFGNDPEWKRVAAESEAGGKLVARVESTMLRTVDFSPKKVAKKGKGPRVFELRTYKATPGNLDGLLARFRNHTFKLFEKHGMTNLWYWTSPRPDDHLLVYILSHPSREAGLAAFDNFRKDPDWIAARKASEEKAGGSLTVKVESLYMLPTDFSPVR